MEDESAEGTKLTKPTLPIETPRVEPVEMELLPSSPETVSHTCNFASF
jgi:hypothetical protein